MGILTLIEQARQVGLEIRVEGGRLIVKGDRQHAEIAKELGKRKKEVVDYFDAPREERSDSQYIGGGTGTAVNPEEKEGCGASDPPETNQSGGWPSRISDPVHWGGTTTRRLVGRGFPVRPTPIVPTSILASPRLPCPTCTSGRVLPELASLTAGRCYACWSRGPRV